MAIQSGLSVEDVKRWKGQPVCVVLKNGSYYVGVIAKVEKGSILFAGQKGTRKFNASAFRKAQHARVSGLFPGMLNSFGLGGGGMNPIGLNSGIGGFMPGFGQNAGAGGFGGLGGLMGTVKKAWPGIRMGIGMMKTIMPLLGGIKF